MTSVVAGLVTLIGAVLIALIAWYIAGHRTPGEPASETTPRLYRVRFRYFLVLVAVLVISFAVTVPMVPYVSAKSATPDIVVDVTGHMWYWELRRQPSHQPVVSVPRGALVEFDVTSADVNHGFALYDDDGQLVAQTQAMPGYVNRLRYRFVAPGTYHILCLEYCGVAHHAMFSRIEAK